MRIYHESIKENKYHRDTKTPRNTEFFFVSSATQCLCSVFYFHVFVVNS